MVDTLDKLTLGLEEEYLIVDVDTRDLVEAPRGLVEACNAKLDGAASPEFLECQVEIGTKVCQNVSEARAELIHARRVVRDCAQEFGLSVIAASCHPFADWKNQHHTQKSRYEKLAEDLQTVGHRMLICGAHCHIGIDDPDERVDIMRQLTYFLPHLLALSASSPFWQGIDTGLASYRLTVFDNLPRTGLPPDLRNYREFQDQVATLIDLSIIEDSTTIWWDLRPSGRFPTLETRICDVSPRLEHALSIAALIQCLIRMLMRLRRDNRQWRVYESFLVEENRWRAQRYGVQQGLVDFGRRKIAPMPELVRDIIELTHEDAEALGCVRELARLEEMAKETSADRQRRVYRDARAEGHEPQIALKRVVDHLIEEYSADL